MVRSNHRIAIDIHHIPYRGCRPFQERIADYGMTGRPLFEWDKMRERFFVRGNQQIVEICEPCPMNIFGGLEGCQGDVEGFTGFLKVLMSLRPESILFKYRYQDDRLSHEETRALLAEFQDIVQMMSGMDWPVAQIYVNGAPREVETPRRLAFFEWEGEEGETFIFSNEGYSVGVGKDGIVVKDAANSFSADLFGVLRRARTRVTGETTEGRIVNFDPVRDSAPAWDDEPSYVDSELVFTRMNAADIYNDVLQVFSTCAEIALTHNAGLHISALG